PVYLQGLRATLRIRPMEHVRLLPRTHRVVQGRDDVVADQRRNRQERRVVEDLVVGLSRRGVFRPRPELVDLGFEVPEATVVNHSVAKRTARSTKSFMGLQKTLIDFGMRPRRLR